MARSGKTKNIASLAQDPPAPAADSKGKAKTKEISHRVIASDAQTPPSSSANNKKKKKTDVKSTREITWKPIETIVTGFVGVVFGFFLGVSFPYGQLYACILEKISPTKR